MQKETGTNVQTNTDILDPYNLFSRGLRAGQLFLNNSVRVQAIKLKLDMLDKMNNTFQNTVFQISADVPLTLHMAGSYHLTMFIHYLPRLVVPASEKLPFTFEFWAKIILGNIGFPHPGLHLAHMAEQSLGLPCTLRFIRSCVFTFVLVLIFCSVEYAFLFRLIASSLAIVFCSALNCV